MTRAPVGRCAWCRSSTADVRARYCSKRCRQTAFRLRQRRASARGPGVAAGATFAYADPPYPGLAEHYYGKESTYAGEVDHRALIASLVDGGHLGWALSTSSSALREVLPLCPPGARVCPWVKPNPVPASTWGISVRWEALIVVGGRALRPGKRDWLQAMPARKGGTLPGRKPIAFCAFLFDALGMLPGDSLIDLFPGTGIVGNAWSEASIRR